MYFGSWDVNKSHITLIESIEFTQNDIQQEKEKYININIQK